MQFTTYFCNKIINVLLVILLVEFIPKPLHSSNINETSPGIEYLEKKPEHDYILGEGDLLEIKIIPDLLEGEYRIDSTGSIYLRKLDKIYISGLSLNELTKVLNDKYSTILNVKPQVQVIVKSYRPISIYVSGEVETPGKYVFGSRDDSLGADSEENFGRSKNTDGLNLRKDKFLLSLPISRPTIFEAVQAAGGINRFSNLSDIRVTRINSLSKGGGRIQASVNFLNYMNGKDTSQNIRLFDGDIIFVKQSKKEALEQISNAVKSNLNPKYINVFVTGRVNQPGLQRVTKSSVLTDAVNVAGGKLLLKGPVNFIRFNSDGTVDKRKFSYRENAKRGTYMNPYLKDGDIIRLDKSALVIAGNITREIMSAVITLKGVQSILN